jgi:membrane peptidoglycan carboxypeptidase
VLLTGAACGTAGSADEARPLQLLYADRTVMPQGSLAAKQVLAELARVLPGQDTTGLRAVTTIDPKAQRALEGLANGADPLSPMRGQPANLQAAAVAVEPKTGRVAAYYGGEGDTDYAGVIVDAQGRVTGQGYHPPGLSFAPYEIAEALRQHVSVKSRWLSPGSMDFPRSGRTAANGNPITDDNSCPTGSTCKLVDAVSAGLNIPAYALAEKLNPANILDMARACGIGGMWSQGPSGVERTDLGTPAPSTAFVPLKFQMELSLGQYPITVLDHAAGMATFGAGGAHARTHFVISVERDGKPIYQEPTGSQKIGLDDAQLRDLNWTLSQTRSGDLGADHTTPVAAGTWKGTSSDAWLTGYTDKYGVAVWVGGKTASQPAADSTGRPVTGETLPAAIYRTFIGSAIAGTPPVLNPPSFTGDPDAGNAGT